MFTYGLDLGLLLWVWFEKTGHGVETPIISNKVKIPGTAVSKEGHAEMKGPVNVYSLEKVPIVKNSSYSQLLRQNSPYLLNDTL